MTAPGTDPRVLALRVARALRDKGKSAEAVLVLSAWAASGPNDAEGQALLAEALRLAPQSPVAKLAFERMEGVAGGDQAALDEAIARYPAAELQRLDQERRPVFQRAQVGFNNNVKYKGRPYHVQTEDSGLGKPHIITHVFADGGRIIKSHKRSYAGAVDREDVALYVRSLMKGQHMEMVQWLREGRFDPIIDGQRPGGMEVLELPPVVDVTEVGTRRAAPPAADTPKPPAVVASAPEPAATAVAVPAPPGKVGTAGPAAKAGAVAAAAPSAVVPPPPRPTEPSVAEVPPPPVRVTLHVLRSLSGGPDRYDPPGDIVVIGSEGAVSLPGERFCHPSEALLTWEEGRLWLDDLEGGNGVFVRIRSPVVLGPGGEFIVGDQLLRLERNPDANDGPDEGPTYFFSSQKGASAFRVTQIFEGGSLGACAMAREALLQIGSALEYANDLVLHQDPLVAAYHCVIEEQAEVFVLTDLGAKSGVFVRVSGRHALAHGDELLVGRTRLMIDLGTAAAAPA